MSYKSIKDWRVRTKDRIVESMGGKCVCCGYNKHTSALELHHLNPSNKMFSFGGIRARPKSWDSIVQELRKCVMVCCLCHREIEAGVRILPSVYSTFDETYASYEKAKPRAQCPLCKIEFVRNTTRQIYCSSICSSIKRRKVHRPTDLNEVHNLLSTMSVEAVGRHYGVTGNSIRKWIKNN